MKKIILLAVICLFISFTNLALAMNEPKERVSNPILINLLNCNLETIDETFKQNNTYLKLLPRELIEELKLYFKDVFDRNKKEYFDIYLLEESKLQRQKERREALINYSLLTALAVSTGILIYLLYQHPAPLYKIKDFINSILTYLKEFNDKLTEAHQARLANKAQNNLSDIKSTSSMPSTPESVAPRPKSSYTYKPMPPTYPYRGEIRIINGIPSLFDGIRWIPVYNQF